MQTQNELGNEGEGRHHRRAGVAHEELQEMAYDRQMEGKSDNKEERKSEVSRRDSKEMRSAVV